MLLVLWYLLSLLSRILQLLWQVMKTFAEKLSNLHQQLMSSWQELMRDVHKYNTEQQKKHREVAYAYMIYYCYYQAASCMHTA